MKKNPLLNFRTNPVWRRERRPISWRLEPLPCRSLVWPRLVAIVFQGGKSRKSDCIEILNDIYLSPHKEPYFSPNKTVARSKPSLAPVCWNYNCFTWKINRIKFSVMKFEARPGQRLDRRPILGRLKLLPRQSPVWPRLVAIPIIFQGEKSLKNACIDILYEHQSSPQKKPHFNLIRTVARSEPSLALISRNSDFFFNERNHGKLPITGI